MNGSPSACVVVTVIVGSTAANTVSATPRPAATPSSRGDMTAFARAPLGSVRSDVMSPLPMSSDSASSMSARTVGFA